MVLAGLQGRGSRGAGQRVKLEWILELPSVPGAGVELSHDHEHDGVTHEHEHTQLGQRQTRQRDAILRVIRDAAGPLSVPEIHERAGLELPKIGIATIYRTLKLLQEGHLIHPVILPSGESRFEAAGTGHHEHFQCRNCQQVFDIHFCPLTLPVGNQLPGGFVVEDHELTLYGLCPDCSK